MMQLGKQDLVVVLFAAGLGAVGILAARTLGALGLLGAWAMSPWIVIGIAHRLSAHPGIVRRFVFGCIPNVIVLGWLFYGMLYLSPYRATTDAGDLIESFSFWIGIAVALLSPLIVAGTKWPASREGQEKYQKD